MRVVAWNLRHGGGSRRMALISLALLEHAPDLVVLSEFRRTTGGQIAGVLADKGLGHQATTDPPKGRNGLLVASRWPLAGRSTRSLSRGPTPSTGGLLAEDVEAAPLAQRWLDLQIAEINVELIAVHAPHDDPFDGGRVSTARAAFFQALVAAARERSDRRALLVGDFNAGRHRTDEEGATFSLTGALGAIASLGYVDAWRHLNPDGREYTWFSHTGSGFRIDHAFLSRALAPRLSGCRYSHAERESGLSDHSVLVLDLG